MCLFTASLPEAEKLEALPGLPDCDEGTLAWIPKTELSRLKLWEGDRVFLRLLDECEDFFSLKLVYEGDRLVSCALNGREPEAI